MKKETKDKFEVTYMHYIYEKYNQKHSTPTLIQPNNNNNIMIS